jgi:GxxExxY protein
MENLTKSYLKNLTYQIIGAAIEVHKEMGPGLLEQVYEECMIEELELRGIKTTRQLSVPIKYKGKMLKTELRYDLLVEGCIVVELKAVTEMAPIFEAQVMTYAKLLGVPKAILINFTCEHIYRQGQKTFVNEFFRQLPE